MDWPSASVTIAFFMSDACRDGPSSASSCPSGEGVHARHVDAEQSLDRRLDLRLGGVVRDLEHDRILLGEQGRLLGDVGARTTS
jgi:hypothetical protein